MPVTPTKIVFCSGIYDQTAIIQKVKFEHDHCFIVTDSTPFHPVSHIWADHPADRGSLTIHKQIYPVIDCQVGAVELATGELFVGQAIPVKRGEAGWAFVVVHVLHTTTDETLPSLDDSTVKEGIVVELSVELPYRHALSRGHSAGHLASMALNKVLAEHYWRKAPSNVDPLGNHDFNGYAQEISLVSEDGCYDRYRLGKSLRKRGFNSAEMLNDLDTININVNQQLKEWILLDSPVVMRCEGESLTDSRYWQCELGESQMAVMPCGGTHVQSLAEFQQIEVRLTQIDDQYIEMHTHVIPTSF